jgi:hypothetical protein
MTAPDPWAASDSPLPYVGPPRAYWTSPDSWVDPDCIECGGEGAPCCDPPSHPYDDRAG